MKNPENVLYYMRSRLGLTQKQIAKATGLTEQDISRIENGADNPFIETFILLARYFNIPIDAFVHNNLKIALSSFTKPPQILHNNSKRIKAKRDKCDEIGHKGERYVYKEEFEKLRGTGHENAINPNFADNDESDFDILSFDLSGRAIIIEVKTTTGDQSDPFYISSNEINIARQCIKDGRNYEIHRVYCIDDPKRRGKTIITAKELFENYDFIPETYRVVRKEKN
jgi:transcriptional regulator with XRE-family HTH domain